MNYKPYFQAVIAVIALTAMIYSLRPQGYLGSWLNDLQSPKTLALDGEWALQGTRCLDGDDRLVIGNGFEGTANAVYLPSPVYDKSNRHAVKLPFQGSPVFLFEHSDGSEITLARVYHRSRCRKGQCGPEREAAVDEIADRLPPASRLLAAGNTFRRCRPHESGPRPLSIVRPFQLP